MFPGLGSHQTLRASYRRGEFPWLYQTDKLWMAGLPPSSGELGFTSQAITELYSLGQEEEEGAGFLPRLCQAQPHEVAAPRH